MSFFEFLNEQTKLNAQMGSLSPPENPPHPEENIETPAELAKSEIETSSDEESTLEEYFKEKPVYKAVYEDLYATLKKNNPPQTPLELEQLQIIAELQAKVVVQEAEVMILKKMNYDLKNRQQKYTTTLEQMKKEKDVRTQMKIGYDKKFQKLNDKIKLLDATQRQIKKLANATPQDYMESAIQRVKSTVKIVEPPPKAEPLRHQLNHGARKSSQMMQSMRKDTKK